MWFIPLIHTWTVHHSARPSAATRGGWQEYFRLSCSPPQQISIQIYSYTSPLPGSLLCCCHAISPAYVSFFCSLLHLSMSLSTAFGFFPLWILIPPQCLCFPPQLFPKLLPPFLSASLPSCASDWCSLHLPPLMFLDSSHTTQHWFWSHNTFLLLCLFVSPYLFLSTSHTHTFSVSFLLGCQQIRVGMSFSQAEKLPSSLIHLSYLGDPFLWKLTFLSAVKWSKLKCSSIHFTSAINHGEK